MSKKQKGILWGGIIAASLVFSLVLQFLGLEGHSRAISLTLWLLAMVVIYMVFAMRAGRKTVAKIQEANRIFTEEHDTDRYIQALTELLDTEEDSQAQQVLRINLTAAYCDKREYEKARATLQALNPKKLNPQNRAFFWVNMALTNFYLGDEEEGMRIVELQKKAFDQMRTAKQTGPALAFIEIFELLHRGLVEDAQALLETARATWENEHTAPDFAFMAEKCGVTLEPLPEKEA